MTFIPGSEDNKPPGTQKLNSLPQTQQGLNGNFVNPKLQQNLLNNAYQQPQPPNTGFPDSQNQQIQFQQKTAFQSQNQLNYGQQSQQQTQNHPLQYNQFQQSKIQSPQIPNTTNTQTQQQFLRNQQNQTQEHEIQNQYYNQQNNIQQTITPKQNQQVNNTQSSFLNSSSTEKFAGSQPNQNLLPNNLQQNFCSDKSIRQLQGNPQQNPLQMNKNQPTNIPGLNIYSRKQSVDLFQKNVNSNQQINADNQYFNIKVQPLGGFPKSPSQQMNNPSQNLNSEKSSIQQPNIQKQVSNQQLINQGQNLNLGTPQNQISPKQIVQTNKQNK